MEQYIIGIDAGGTKTAYGLFLGSVLVDRVQHPTDIVADGATFSDKVVQTVNELLVKHNLTIGDLKGIGVCMPSFIMFDEGYICLTSAMTNIKEFPMRQYLYERLPTKIVLDNDANCAALAEHRHGAGRGSKHMMYVATSTGIGGGIIIDKKVFRGSYGFAGECGHMLITPDIGVECGCENKGCFMSYASGRFAPMHVKQKLKEGRESILSQYDDITGERLLNAYYENDELAVETVCSMAHYIAVCVFNIYQLLNINLYVFGGGLVNFGDIIFDRVRSEFARFDHIGKPVHFTFAELEKDFGIIGAAELINE